MESNYQNLNNYYLQKYPIFKELASPILISTPLKSLAYQRLYTGGKHFIFFTNREYSQCFFETVHELCPTAHEIVTSLPKNHAKLLLWTENNVKPIFTNLLRYNIAQGLTIYRRHEDFVDCYYFAGDRDSPNLSNYYINNTSFLLDYVSYFELHAKNVITVEDNALGKHTGSNILTHFKDEDRRNENSINRFYINSTHTQNSTTLRFSRRELECLNALGMGYSVKYIAKQFDISNRTLECYVDSIKKKLNINYKDQIVDWFHKNKNFLQNRANP